MTPEQALSSANSRPWPPPDSPWVMSQIWRKLLFAHWPVPAEMVRPLLPAGLALDTWDGQAWLGIVPFQMERVRFRGLPGIPTATRFGELNVRTYVTADDKPGVFFFSLDAGSLLAVLGARALFALPYYHARFAIAAVDNTIYYRCERKGSGKPRAVFEARYQPTGPVQLAQPGSLEDWLTARYCLYTTRGARLMRGEIHHAPWPLQPATANIVRNTIAEPAGIRLPATPPLLYYSEQLEVVVWPLRAVHT
ncbi:MAG TPA: DUF2071 domain-containing protein [Ktedonobacterales bacterium]|nr:DUF2071 domain-containing protein [Ktedonobacterales bacterium]